jgi:hypothetical protein
MATIYQNEVLSTALDAQLRAAARVAGGEFTFEAVSAEIRATNRLLDAAVACGFDPSEPDLVGWASERVARFLVEA